MKQLTSVGNISFNYMFIFPELFLSIAILYSIIFGLITGYNSRYKYPIIVNFFIYLACYILFLTLLLIFNEDLGYLKLTNFFDSLSYDYISYLSKVITILSTIVCLLFIKDYLLKQRVNKIEYIIILLFSVLGLLILCSANDFLTVYLGMEMSSLAFYLLAGFRKRSSYSVDAGLKYFILGSFSSALFLFGSSFIYGAYGSINFDEIRILSDFYLLDPNNIFAYFDIEKSKILNDTVLEKMAGFSYTSCQNNELKKDILELLYDNIAKPLDKNYFLKDSMNYIFSTEYALECLKKDISSECLNSLECYKVCLIEDLIDYMWVKKFYIEHMIKNNMIVNDSSIDLLSVFPKEHQVFIDSFLETFTINRKAILAHVYNNLPVGQIILAEQIVDYYATESACKGAYDVCNQYYSEEIMLFTNAMTSLQSADILYEANKSDPNFQFKKELKDLLHSLFIDEDLTYKFFAEFEQDLGCTKPIYENLLQFLRDKPVIDNKDKFLPTSLKLDFLKEILKVHNIYDTDFITIVELQYYLENQMSKYYGYLEKLNDLHANVNKISNDYKPWRLTLTMVNDCGCPRFGIAIPSDSSNIDFVQFRKIMSDIEHYSEANRKILSRVNSLYDEIIAPYYYSHQNEFDHAYRCFFKDQIDENQYEYISTLKRSIIEGSRENRLLYSKSFRHVLDSILMNDNTVVFKLSSDFKTDITRRIAVARGHSVTDIENLFMSMEDNCHYWMEALLHFWDTKFSAMRDNWDTPEFLSLFMRTNHEQRFCTNLFTNDYEFIANLNFDNYTETLEFIQLKKDFELDDFFKFQHFVVTGLLLILFSLFFKLSLAPFHLWSPDVYESSPTSSSFFFAVVPKISIFVVLLRLMYSSMFFSFNWIKELLLLVATISVVAGSLGGLYQRKMKSLLTYSSISHMGYLMIAFSSASLEGLQALFFYMIIYVITGLCIWSILITLRLKKTDKIKQNKDLGDFVLLYKSNYFLALIFMSALFSIAGIPPLVGFLAKMNIFLVAIENKFYIVSIISVLFSVVSTFFYLRLIKVMYFEAVLVGRLYFPIYNNANVIIAVLFFSLFLLFINPTYLYLISYKNSYLFQ